MNNELRIFNNTEFGEIRTVTINEQPYFMASDVATALGYARPNDAISTHCRATVKHSTLISGKMQAVNFIPESDIYRLIIKSKLPSAERFEKWVMEEVLPSIRKNGGYIANQENLSSEQILANAVLVAQNVIAEKDKLITEMQPKAIFADAVATSNTSILIGDLAKILSQNGIAIGQKRLFDWMRDKGYLIKQKGTSWNMPTQKAMDLGLFEVKESTINNPDGSVRINRTTKVTGKGQQYFINKFIEGVA